jgi:hypothetical protein
MIDLGYLIPGKFYSDDRQPLVVLTSPFDGADYGFYLPSAVYWIETLGVSVLHGLVTALVSLRP